MRDHQYRCESAEPCTRLLLRLGNARPSGRRLGHFGGDDDGARSPAQHAGDRPMRLPADSKQEMAAVTNAHQINEQFARDHKITWAEAARREVDAASQVGGERVGADERLLLSGLLSRRQDCLPNRYATKPARELAARVSSSPRSFNADRRI